MLTDNFNPQFCVQTDEEIALDTEMREEIASEISALGTTQTEYLLSQRSTLLEYGAENVTQTVADINDDISNMEAGNFIQ